MIFQAQSKTLAFGKANATLYTYSPRSFPSTFTSTRLASPQKQHTPNLPATQRNTNQPTNPSRTPTSKSRHIGARLSMPFTVFNHRRYDNRFRGRRDSSAQITDGTIGTMTVETTSTFFDSSTQTGKWWMYLCLCICLVFSLSFCLADLLCTTQYMYIFMYSTMHIMHACGLHHFSSLPRTTSFAHRTLISRCRALVLYTLRRA